MGTLMASTLSGWGPAAERFVRALYAAEAESFIAFVCWMKQGNWPHRLFFGILQSCSVSALKLQNIYGNVVTAAFGVPTVSTRVYVNAVSTQKIFSGTMFRACMFTPTVTDSNTLC